MGECPFCGSQVDEDLITFGGPCPKCFADIPGEEAATDPGEDVKAAQARRDQMRTTARSVLPIVLALPVVFVLGIAALWFVLLRPEPEVILLDFDELEGFPMPELVAAAEPAPQPDPVAPTPRPTSSGGDGVADAGPDVAAPRPAPSQERQAGLDLGLDVSTARRGTVLEDADAIKKMIGDRMAAQAPRLNACYEAELKTNETLAGRWRVGFTVTTEGRTSEPLAEALSGSVPSFEDCLKREVGKWTFQRIARDQPVRRTFTFRPL